MLFYQAISREAFVWKMASHENVLEFIGIWYKENTSGLRQIALVSPWMKHGNLLQYVCRSAQPNRLKLVRRREAAEIADSLSSVTAGCSGSFVSSFRWNNTW